MDKPHLEKDESLSQRLRLVVYSFGFKYGVPIDATMIWDVRFLPNPFWQEALRPLSGLDRDVADYVLTGEAGKTFLELLTPLLLFLVEASDRSGRSHLRLAIGCTGGRHRSVAVVEALRRILDDHGVAVTVFHRDREREENR